MNIQYLSLLVLEHNITGETKEAEQIGWKKGKLGLGAQKAIRWDPICCPSDIQSMAYVPEYVDIYFHH